MELISSMHWQLTRALGGLSDLLNSSIQLDHDYINGILWNDSTI